MSVPIFTRPDVLYASPWMYQQIVRYYGNATAYVGLRHDRELRRVTWHPAGYYELELGPAVPVLARPKLPLLRRTG